MKLSEHRNALVLKHGLENTARWWKRYFRKRIQHRFQVHRYCRWKRSVRSFVHPSCQERFMGAIDIWICVSLSRCPLCSSINTLAADCSLLPASESCTLLTVLRGEAAKCRFPKDRANLWAIVLIPPNQACIFTEENERREWPLALQLHASLPS